MPLVPDSQMLNKKRRPSSSAGTQAKRRRLRMETLEQRRVLAAITWDGEAGNLNWDDPLNWDLDRRPNSSDDVFIPDINDDGETLVLHNTSNGAANKLQVDPDVRLVIASHEFFVYQQATIDGTLQLGVDTTETNRPNTHLRGPGHYVINGAFEWNPQGFVKADMTIAESGTAIAQTTDVSDAGTIYLTKGASFEEPPQLEIQGTFELHGENRLVQQSASEIHNHGEFVFNGGASLSTGFQSGFGFFTNHEDGIVRKIGPASSYVFRNAGFDSFNNDGLVRVEEGLLGIYRNSVTTGRFEILAGATYYIRESGNSLSHRFGPTSTITGTTSGSDRGRFYIDGGSPHYINYVYLEGTLDVPWMVVDGRTEVTIQPGANVQFGDLDLIDHQSQLLTEVDIEVAGHFHYTRGRIQSNSEAVLTLSGTSELTVPDASVSTPLFYTNLLNTGTMVVAGEENSQFFTRSDRSWINEGTIEIGQLAKFGNGSPITNRGTIIKPADTGITSIWTSAASFVNEGIIEVGLNSLLSNRASGGPMLQNAGEIRGPGFWGVANNVLRSHGGVISAPISVTGLENHGSVMTPGGEAFFSQYLGTSLTNYGGGTIHIDIGGTTPGVDADEMVTTMGYTLGGTLEIDRDESYVPNPGDTIPILRKYDDSFSFSITGTFDRVVGRIISPTLAWEVGYNADNVTLTAVAITEAELAEIIRQETNAGITRTREQFDEWLELGTLTLPGYSQSLGEIFASSLSGVGQVLLPTIDTPVTSIADLKSQAAASGYAVGCAFGDAGCTELLEISVPNRETTDSISVAPDIGFSGLTGLADEISLAGTLDWDATVKLTNFEIGYGFEGFFVEPVAEIAIEVLGGGDLTQDDFAIAGGAFALDLQANVSTDPTKPIAASVSPTSRLTNDQLAQINPANLNVVSSGQSTLNISHTIDPGNLTYDGSWIVEQAKSGDGFESTEISGSVDYPSVDDWLASSIGVFGGAIEAILGPEAAANFNEVSLPFIADAAPADVAPGLVGINPAEDTGPEPSWMQKLFAGAKTVFSFFGDDSGAGEGMFGSQGDGLTGADLLRFHRSVSGSNIKVGVISTGAAGMDYAKLSGDLPANISTLINPNDSPFGGGGTAMMEVIHDLAPDAQLSFAAATDAQSLFRAVTWLTEIQGVDIIVSDVNDYSESFFHADGLTDFIQSQIEEHEVLYVQAAGNDGQRSYQDRPEPSTHARYSSRRSSTEPSIDFGGTTANPESTLEAIIDANSSVRFVLQTDQSVENPTAHIVLQPLMIPQGIEINRTDFSIEHPDSRDPNVPLTVDSFVLTNRTGEPVSVDLVVEMIAGELDRRIDTPFRIVAIGDAQLKSTKGPQIFGAALARDALVVGAVDVASTDAAAPYTSFGSAFGASVDLVGPASVSTSGFGMRFADKFHGTSSGAAHVAAIAALLKEIQPSASPALISSVLKLSAKPIGSGEGDLQSGFGLVDALAASQELDPISIPPDEPAPRPKPTTNEFLSNLSQFTELVTPTQEVLDNLLASGEVLIGDLMQLRVRLDADSVGTFKADFPFLFDGIAGFDQFDISGSVGIDASPAIDLQFGWDADGWYLEVDTAKLGVNVEGTGKARGVAFDSFGVGLDGKLAASPYIDVTALDRAGDGRIRQDDIDQLSADLLGGDVSLVGAKARSSRCDSDGRLDLWIPGLHRH